MNGLILENRRDKKVETAEDSIRLKPEQCPNDILAPDEASQNQPLTQPLTGGLSQPVKLKIDDRCVSPLHRLYVLLSVPGALLALGNVIRHFEEGLDQNTLQAIMPLLDLLSFAILPTLLLVLFLCCTSTGCELTANPNTYRRWLSVCGLRIPYQRMTISDPSTIQIVRAPLLGIRRYAIRIGKGGPALCMRWSYERCAEVAEKIGDFFGMEPRVD
jgi:hypothetical protein